MSKQTAIIEMINLEDGVFGVEISPENSDVWEGVIQIGDMYHWCEDGYMSVGFRNFIDALKISFFSKYPQSNHYSYLLDLTRDTESALLVRIAQMGRLDFVRSHWEKNIWNDDLFDSSDKERAFSKYIENAFDIFESVDSLMDLVTEYRKADFETIQEERLFFKSLVKVPTQGEIE